MQSFCPYISIAKKIGLDIAGSFSQFLFFSNYIQVINTQIWKIVRIFHKSCTQMFPWYIALFVSALLLKNCMHFWKTIQNIYISTKCSMKIKQPILKLLRVLTFFPQKLAYSFFKSCKWVFLIKLNSYFGFFYLFWFSNKNTFWADQNKQQISRNKIQIGLVCLVEYWSIED